MEDSLTRGCVSRAASVCPLRHLPLMPSIQFYAGREESSKTSSRALSLSFAFLFLIPGKLCVLSLEDGEQPGASWCLPRTILKGPWGS